MEVLEYYAYKAPLKVIPNSTPRRTIRFPKVFSFIEAPDDAIEVLNDLVRFSLEGRNKDIDIRQDECSLIDHCAESAATALAIQARGWPMVRFQGTFPQSQEQREIVLATGLASRIGANLPEPDGFLKFRLQHGRGSRGTAERSAPKEVFASRLTLYVNDCLKGYGYELTARAKNYLTQLAAEVLDNAEEHSERRDWWVAGYLRQKSTGSFGDCHITIFNFGRTLAESLQELPVGSQLRTDIEALVQSHKQRGFFASGWTEENLWTLYALQGGVSRLNTGRTSLGDTRGYGTVRMLEFFESIGKTAVAGHPPKMCIVSGHTHLLFDGTYQMRLQKTRRGEQANIIAFNKENDLQIRPDAKYVTDLKKSFPGTLISLRFFLDKDHLDKLGGGN